MWYRSGASWRRWWTVGLVGGAAVVAACSDDPFGGASQTFGAEITTGDTLVFEGETVIYTALAIYGVGPGTPQSVRWGASDTTVLEVEVRSDGRANVDALKAGTSWITAYVNEAFYDSAFVTVVPRGGDRWANTYAGVPTGLYPAIGADSLVRIVTGGASPLLRILAPESGSGTSVASCYSALGPSLGVSDVTFATGQQCTRRHAQNGDSTWSASPGSAALGVAVAADGGAITVTADSVFRLNATGDVLWELPVGGTVRTAPVLGPGGDVYVGWTAGGADSVSRIALAGALRWSAAVPGLSVGSPAATDTRLFFGRPGGVFAIDSAGVIAWDRSFSANNAAATATGATSSPVHDNVSLFVQNEEALYAYGIGGSFIWAADSLGFGDASGPVGAPVLLFDGTLVVPCAAGADTRGVCGVRQFNGTRAWRSPDVAGSVEALAVGGDGMIYVTRSIAGGSQVAALWGRVRPLAAGWPAEGGNQQHTRRR
jgi:hypothetical protein